MKPGRAAFTFLGLLLASWPAVAMPLVLPDSARPVFESSSPLDSYALPVGVFADGRVPTDRIEGQVERQAWRLDGTALTTLQVLAPLRDQLENAGYEIVFECRDLVCGGYDFRFGIEVLPAPGMYVDIRDFGFVAARADAGTAVGLLVSKSRSAAFVQAISVSEVARGAVASEPGLSTRPDATTQTGPGTKGGGLTDQLLRNGHVILADLKFAPGGSSLEEGAYASLSELAAFMAENPERIVVLVGHTDSVGDLASNIQLSKRRAEAVRTRLIGTFDVDPRRVAAEGNGYLSPVAPNLTAEGREANRRVEAILLR